MTEQKENLVITVTVVAVNFMKDRIILLEPAALFDIHCECFIYREYWRDSNIATLVQYFSW